MTSPEFDDLVDRATSSLSDEDLSQARNIQDIEAALDRKFFTGGRGDQLTRYQDVPIKTLIANDIFKNTSGMREGVYEHEYERRGGVVGVVREMFAPLRIMVRRLPLFAALRSSFSKSIIGKRRQREASARSAIIRRQARPLTLRKVVKPVAPRRALKKSIGRFVLGKGKRKKSKRVST